MLLLFVPLLISANSGGNGRKYSVSRITATTAVSRTNTTDSYWLLVNILVVVSTSDVYLVPYTIFSNAPYCNSTVQQLWS